MNIAYAIYTDPIIGLELLAILLCAIYIVQTTFQQEKQDFDFALIKTGLRQVCLKSAHFSSVRFFSPVSLLSQSTR